MSAVFLNALGVVCALGQGEQQVRSRLFAGEPLGVAATDRFSPGKSLYLGCVADVMATAAHVPLEQRSRNNALIAAALTQLRLQTQAAADHFGPHRIAVVLGTSTSGVAEGEAAARHRQANGTWPAGYHHGQEELVSGARFIARELEVTGPAYVVSTACSSGAKTLISAARMLHAGLADAVIAGGADALSRFTIDGFTALDSVSAGRCNPLSAHRDGINLGEGTALFLMSRRPGPVRLAGWGETSDAYHMSAPDPSGRGAATAIAAALRRADIEASAIDYVNLHGTATLQNDAMESMVVHAAFGSSVPVSSTKPVSGHALAAAGAIEAAFAWITLTGNGEGRLPPHWWDGQQDPALPLLHAVQPGEELGRPANYILSNSFAFGGSNAALIFARQ